jgi:hypothetical protein
VTKKRPTSKEPNISAVHQHRTDKDIFCHSQEFLLFVDRYDCLFVHEAELRPIRLNDAVRDCQDTTAQIIRMDQENWCGEDVTEDIAHAWLDTYEPEPTHEDTLPAFVLESEAWQLYSEDFKARYDGADHKGRS